MKKNTNKKGVARILVYPSKNKYIGVCLDFDIVKEADTKKEAMDQIKEATEGYIINVIKNNLDDSLLNRNAPEHYWKVYKEYNKFIRAKDEEKVKKVSPQIRSSSFFAYPIIDIIENNSLSLSQ